MRKEEILKKIEYLQAELRFSKQFNKKADTLAVFKELLAAYAALNEYQEKEAA